MKTKYPSLAWLLTTSLLLLMIIAGCGRQPTPPRPDFTETHKRVLHELKDAPLPITAEESQSVDAVAYSPSSRLFAWGQGNGDTLVGNVPQATKSLWTQTSMPPKGGMVGSLAWSADGRYLAAAHADAKVRVWDVENVKLVKTLSVVPAKRQVYSLAFAPNDGDHRLACGTEGGYTVVVDALTGKQLAKLTGHVGEVRAVTWHPNGKELLSASGSEVIRWDTTTYKAKGRLPGQGIDIRCMAFSPDGRTLAIGGTEVTSSGIRGGALYIRTANSGAVLNVHSDVIHSIAWRQDGRKMFTASNDRSIKEWDTAALVNNTADPEPRPTATWRTEGLAFGLAASDTTLLIGTSQGVCSVGIPPEAIPPDAEQPQAEGSSNWRDDLRKFVAEQKAKGL